MRCSCLGRGIQEDFSEAESHRGCHGAQGGKPKFQAESGHSLEAPGANVTLECSEAIHERVDGRTGGWWAGLKARRATYFKVLILLLRQRLLRHHKYSQALSSHVSTLKSRWQSAESHTEGSAPESLTLTERGWMLKWTGPSPKETAGDKSEPCLPLKLSSLRKPSKGEATSRPMHRFL